MSNLLNAEVATRAKISAAHKMKQRWRDRGFTDELCIDMIYAGNSDQRAEQQVGNFFIESILNWNFIQYCGDSRTDCDHIAQCSTYGKINIEVKSAIVNWNHKHESFGQITFQGIKPDNFDIIFFVSYGQYGVNIEMMNKKEYLDIFGYSKKVIFKNTAITPWRPSVNTDGSLHARSKWCVDDNSRNEYLQGNSESLHDCLGDFDAEFRMAMSHMEQPAGCPA